MAEKEAKAHSDEMSIHLGGTNLSWFDTAIDEVAGTTLFNKNKPRMKWLKRQKTLKLRQ